MEGRLRQFIVERLCQTPGRCRRRGRSHLNAARNNTCGQRMPGTNTALKPMESLFASYYLASGQMPGCRIRSISQN